jgi:hypothetical protein
MSVRFDRNCSGPAGAKDVEAILATGRPMYNACSACHEEYVRDDLQ